MSERKESHSERWKSLKEGGRAEINDRQQEWLKDGKKLKRLKRMKENKKERERDRKKERKMTE